MINIDLKTNRDMEIKEFIENFDSVLDDTDLSTLTPETKLREIDEWSSLCALNLMAMANMEYDVDLEAEDIRDAETIQDVFNVIQAKA
jgi:acyl carrier protein